MVENLGPPLIADKALTSGYSFATLDWRGQGLSDRLSKDRMLGDVRTYSEYQQDVAAFVTALETPELPKPWFLLGHSMGACIGLRAAIEGLPVNACAFTAPLWDINLSGVRRLAAGPISAVAVALGQAQSYAPGTEGKSYVLHTPFEDNRLTHDNEMYQYYIDISEGLVEQQLGGPSMRWLNATLKETRELKSLSSPSLPCLTLYGTDDSIISHRAISERMQCWRHGELVRVPGAKHDLLYEVREIRDLTFRSIIDFFQDVR